MTIMSELRSSPCELIGLQTTGEAWGKKAIPWAKLGLNWLKCGIHTGFRKIKAENPRFKFESAWGAASSA